jgi:N-methylhydantoinase A
MGGTSCDVCVVQGGEVQERSAGELAGRPVALPMLAVHTVGAGGGSIAWRDGGGALRVGPRSAGADPGPACYGRGGDEPTVTDANLVLGYLSPASPLAGGVELDPEAAERVIRRLARELGLEPLDCAEGIVRVAVAEMVRALRVVTVQRGIDPRELALLAFGGAGPLHACQIAEELGMRRILCPRASGVLAALGLVVSPRRRDVQRTLLLSGRELTAEALHAHRHELGAAARAALGDPEAELRAVYELRYRGQAFELPIAAGLGASPDELREAFEAEHERRYGHRDEHGEIELVTLRLTATGPGADVSLRGEPEQPSPAAGTRTARRAGASLELAVIAGGPQPGRELQGPAIVELPESTLLIAPGWRGVVQDTGTIALERGT